MIYDGAPSRMLPALASAIRRQLDAGRRCMYLNTPAMVAGFRSRLYADGCNVELEVERGALVLASDHDHLVGGRFDVDTMIRTLETAAAQAVTDGYTGLFATGDMTWELGPDRDFTTIIDYEWQLEQLFRRQPALSGICQYHRDLLPRQSVRDGAVSHASLFVNATLSRVNPFYVLGRRPEARRVAAAVPELDASLDLLLAEES